MQTISHSCIITKNIARYETTKDLYLNYCSNHEMHSPVFVVFFALMLFLRWFRERKCLRGTCVVEISSWSGNPGPSSLSDVRVLDRSQFRTTMANHIHHAIIFMLSALLLFLPPPPDKLNFSNTVLKKITVSSLDCCYY